MSNIILGAGTIYIAEATEGKAPDTLFTDANKIGVTYGGATLEVKPEIKEVENDFGETVHGEITKHNVTLKCGLAELDGAMIEKNACFGTYTAAQSGGSEPSHYKIGDTDTELKYYAIGFKQRKGVIKVSIIGTNRDGLSLAFSKDNETKIEPTFTAKKDSDGIYVDVMGL